MPENSEMSELEKMAVNTRMCSFVLEDCTIEETWNFYHPKYLCCCGKCHIKKGVFIVGALSIVWVVFNVVLGLANVSLFNGGDSIQMGWGALFMSGTVCLLIANNIRFRPLMRPFIVIQVIGAILALFGIVMFSIFLSTDGSAFGYNVNPTEKKTAVFYLSLCIFAFLLHLTFFYIILRAYRFVKDREWFQGSKTVAL